MAVIAIVLSALLAPSVQAEEPPKNVILADLGLHVIGAGYQRTVNPRFAVQLALELYGPWTLPGLYGEAYKSNLAGLVVRGRAFVYLSKRAPIGFWVSPFAQGGVGQATTEAESRSTTLWAAGLSAGYAFSVARALHIAVGGGVQYHNADIVGVQGPPDFHGFYPTLDLNIGYAF